MLFNDRTTHGFELARLMFDEEKKSPYLEFWEPTTEDPNCYFITERTQYFDDLKTSEFWERLVLVDVAMQQVRRSRASVYAIRAISRVDLPKELAKWKQN